MDLFLTDIKLKDYNFWLIISIMVLSAFGTVVVGSADINYIKMQIIGVVFGIFIMLIFSRINFRYILSMYRPMYLFTLVMLLLVTVAGSVSNNAQRWLQIGSFRFQPSELSKLLLILFFSQYLYKRREIINTFRGIIFILLLAGIPLFLILKQPDLSTTIILAVVLFIIICMYGLSAKNIIIATLAVAVFIISFLFIVNIKGQKIIPEYQQNRVLAWLHPEEYESTDGMQQQNSIQAIGSGQIIGKGLYNNDDMTLKNSHFVPEPQTDFIFAVIGEECGFVGCLFVIIMLFIITAICFIIAHNATSIRGKTICTGIGAWIGIQSFVNISVTTGIFPNTGVTLPFVSYGLTSLWSLFLSIGIVLNIDIQNKIYNRREDIIR